MRDLRLITILMWFVFNSVRVQAQETTEGRISEHSVVSIVALIGLLLIAHIVRKSRKC